MIYASICSGIEAATQAWHPLGWTPAWFSQYDPEHDYSKNPDFASQVLNYHYPTVPNLGDMLKVREHKTYLDAKFNLLVGGTPCQSFSIAGLRKGLGDERGNLALEFIRILIEKQPKWFLWENVPGVLTSGAGEPEEDTEESSGLPTDFACILSAFTGRDIAPQDFEKAGAIEGEFYSIAWRVLDSQYFGVPQRRRRIFVVGYLGKDWRPPVAVLLERESLSRDFTPGGKKRKGTPGNIKGGSGGGSEIGFRQRGFGDYTSNNTSSALKKRDYKDATDLMVSEIAIPLNTMTMQGRPSDNGRMGLGVGEDGDPQNTLSKAHSHAVCHTFSLPGIGDIKEDSVSSCLTKNSGGGGETQNAAYVLHTIFDTTQVTSKLNYSNPQPGDPCHPLVKNGHVPLLIEAPIAFGWQNSPQQGDSVGDVSPTLDKSKTPAVLSQTLVRRLTPLECERLQGFPDYYTDIPGASDSKRYAALGNSMTVQTMRWIGDRIDLVDKCMKSINSPERTSE